MPVSKFSAATFSKFSYSKSIIIVASNIIIIILLLCCFESIT